MPTPNLVKNIGFALLWCIFCNTAYAADKDSLSTEKFHILDNSYEARLEMPLSIHPDLHCLKLTQDKGMWKNMVGQTFGLLRFKTGSTTVSAMMGGFIEMHDVIPQFMSWQLWRGNLGGSLLVEHDALNKSISANSRLVLQIGWYHESQHATDMAVYLSHFSETIRQSMFNNATARSFEYIPLQFHFLQHTKNRKWTFLLTPAVRYYPRPLLLGATRSQKNAYSVEAGVHCRVRPKWDMYVHGLYESIQNDYRQADYIYESKWEHDALLYRQVEWGLSFNNKKRQCSLFMRYSNSNGRGLDFVQRTSQFGGGLRFIL